MYSNKLTFATGNKISAIFVLISISLVALACGGSKAEMPNDAALQTLVKSTTSDFTDALDKGDYKSIRDKSSADFQSQFSEDTLKTTFKTFTDNKQTVSPIFHSAAGMTPTFSPAPSMREEKGNYVLVVNGAYDTKPAQTKFNYEYVWRDNAWKLLTIKYNLE